MSDRPLDGLRPRIVVFDNDGTLVPSHRAANPAIQRGFRRFVEMTGIEAEPPSDARIRELTGQPGSDFFRALLPARLQAQADTLRSICIGEEVAAMRESASFYEPLGETIDELRERGVRLAIATNGGRRYIEAVGERLGYEERFDRVFYHGYRGIVSKSEMVRAALAELGPGPGIFVGDRTADAAAARDAGIPFIGCAYGYGEEAELAGAARIVSTPAELALLLLEICPAS